MECVLNRSEAELAREDVNVVPVQNIDGTC